MRREAMTAYLSRPTASVGSSSSTSQSMLLPGHGKPASGEMVVPANARRAASMPTGTERDGVPMDPRLCRAAFRDVLVRSVGYGAIKLITACETQSRRKPPGTEGGPAREGVALARPDQKLNVSGEAGDAGHLCHHIVFRSLLLVADIVHELQQQEGIASGVEVVVPEHYRWYGECTAEDTIEAGLACAESTWDSPGMVHPKTGARDSPKSLPGSFLLQLVSKTQDCIKVCWPEDATNRDADRVARSFMDTFYVPEGCESRMQSNIKDFVRNYFERLPKTSSFMQLKKVLQQSEGLQTMHGRQSQRTEGLLRVASERRGVWEDADAAPQ